jgi:hypothetical protein
MTVGIERLEEALRGHADSSNETGVAVFAPIVTVGMSRGRNRATGKGSDDDQLEKETTEQLL